MRKVYGKPYFEVVEYVGDYGYANSSSSTCKYLTCLIGGQSEEFSSYVYKYSKDGTTYYIWYSNYETSYDVSRGANADAAEKILSAWGSTDEGVNAGYNDDDERNGYWHIATDVDGEYNES